MRRELALRRRISQERDRERAEEMRREADMVRQVSYSQKVGGFSHF